MGNMWGEIIIDGDKMGGDLLNSAITVSNLKTATVNKVIKVYFFKQILSRVTINFLQCLIYSPYIAYLIN